MERGTLGGRVILYLPYLVFRDFSGFGFRAAGAANGRFAIFLATATENNSHFYNQHLFRWFLLGILGIFRYPDLDAPEIPDLSQTKLKKTEKN